MNSARSEARGWLALALAICVVDQFTKHLASSHLQYGIPHVVMPHFNLTLLHNTGAAFSLFHDQSGWQRWFFTAIALLVGGGVVWWLTTLEAGQKWAPLALALVLGGAFGNLIDRVMLGYVVDFVQVYYRRWSFPAFNVADAAISVGAVMLILRQPRMAGDKAAD